MVYNFIKFYFLHWFNLFGFKSIEPPVIRFLGDETHYLKPGSNFRLGVQVNSGSHATVELLSMNGKLLEGSQLGRCRIEQFGDDFYVNLRNVTMSDAGQYLICASNSAGESTGKIYLHILAEPLPPKAPIEFRTIEKSKGVGEGATVELTWNPPPLRDGESPECSEPVLGYCVERRDGQRRLQFGHLVRLEGAKSLSLCVPDLKPGIEYLFRVTAFNSVGTSEPTYSKPLVIQSPYCKSNYI